MHLRHLTGRLISEVERAMRVNFSGYVSLRDNLFTHLRPMLLRVREQIHMDNPQLDTIQREYPQLWAATRAACDTVEMELALPHIPDSEAAYLAMHFGAVLEQNGALRQAARVVVACPLGMSSSRFLASRIEAAAERHRADRHTGRAVCRLDGRRRPALHLSPHALDGADARPFMHPECVQTGFAAGPD